MSEIILTPANWLYNSGVVGFLSCLDRDDYLENFNNGDKYNFNGNGTIKINDLVFEKIKVDENYFENGKVINLKGKNAFYPNFIDKDGNQKSVFKDDFVKKIKDANKGECSICSNGRYVTLSNQLNEDQKKFFNKIENLNMVHNKMLGPSDKFPNAYWNLNDKFKICHLCTFILIHHHLAFTKLADGSQIFINSPSFKVMYELNRLVKELFGKEEISSKQKREILAMSVIEYARRIQTTLAQWVGMNIEIVIKSSDGIDFYSLPYETVQLISDRKIASLLSDIGEFSILNTVLDGRFDELVEIAEKIIKIKIKSERNKVDNQLVNSLLKRDKNKNSLGIVSQKILDLYANIMERRNIYA